MSSILDALRELEDSRPRTTGQKIASADVPSRPQQSVGTLIAVTGGLAVGAVAFGLLVWGSGILAPGRGGGASPAPDLQPSSPAPARPAWLDTADAPRARIDTGTSTSPERPVTGRAGADSTPEPARDERQAAPSSRQSALEFIAYSPNVSERAATLRLNGRRVTLHQRESAEGLEVQLIMPDRIYVQRGSEVFVMTPAR
ncbi:MAG: hypothetical protein ACREQL_05150 [Candidatus Binatia bacterium]